MVSFGISQPTVDTASGMRPVNLRTDLAPLADLIELVFADSMDSGGRAALREMRMLSRVGAGLNLLGRLNDLALGINMGYVWVEDGKLIGNVSAYPAHWHRDLGSAWIIANVGVHPDYQRQGIARRLMRASMDMIRARRGQTAVLQVDYNNHAARNLYLSLGFIEQRTWRVWRRPAAARVPPTLNTQEVYISHRHRSEWRSEYALAQQVRPAVTGGIGWQRPLHPSLFQTGFFNWLDNLFSLRSMERLVIRSEHNREIVASLWAESGLASSTKMTLMVLPEYAGNYDEVLLGTAVRRYGGNPIILEHPYDETQTNAVLERYRFNPQVTVTHMRWDVP